MKTLWFGLTALVALTVGSQAFAAWSLTVDTPESFTFSHGNVNTTIAPGSGPSPFTSKTTSDLSGSIVTLIAPFHIGIGYEDWSVAQTATCLTCPGGPFPVHFRSDFIFYDVLADIPLRRLNLTLGYGTGTARMAGVVLPSNTPVNIKPAQAAQYILVLGIPLRQFDIHIGFHRVTTEEKDSSIPGQMPPFDKAQASGDMLSAGLRLNF